MRRTKIVCTIGPATSSDEKLEQLLMAGMNIARLNFSHGTYENHAAVITKIRAISKRLGKSVAILQDLQGPKIRTGKLKDGGTVELISGKFITITTRPVEGTKDIISTTYDQLPNDVKPGDMILLADGTMELRVHSVDDGSVKCEVIHGGLLGENKGINLPNVNLSTPALSEKDKEDLKFGLEQEVDYIALSFVRKPSDVEEARDFILQTRASQNDRASTNGKLAVPLISKLEKPEAIERLDAILEVSDGVMIARGDLGVELPPEKVPLIQKKIIERCSERGIPVITATQMLESMVNNPRPTRAEASDVANAILDGTDAVMLSEETATGNYPIEAVKMMSRIARETESSYLYQPSKSRQEHLTHALAVSHAARALAEYANVRAVIAFTRSGTSAKVISKDRPRVPIIAYTPSEAVYNALSLWWGVIPRMCELQKTTEELIAHVDNLLMSEGLMKRGEMIVIMGGLPLVSRAPTNFVKLHRVGSIEYHT